MARETLEEMSMSATLHADKSGTSYTVGKMGSKLKKHGGLKKGEKINDTHVDDLQDSGVKVKIKPYKPTNEAIQRRMDRMTIIATDPATGRKVVKVAPKKQIEIGKGKNESVVNEISDKMKMSYISKANKKITDTEKMRDYQNKQMDKKPGSFSKSDKDFVNKMYDKDTEKRRKGVRMAKGKLGNTVRQTVKQSGMKLGLSQGMKPSNKKLGESFADEVNAMQDALNEISTATLASYQKKAGAQYKTAKRDSDERTAYKPYSVKGGQAMDKADALRKKRGKGLGMSKKILDKRYSDKQVKMGKGIAFDKRYKGGNMTGASKAIDKIKKGLSDHPKVSGALKRANEEFNKGE